MSKYELTFRRTKGSPVTSDEIDQNFRNIKIGHDDHEKRVSALEKINVDFATDEELLFQVQRLDSKIDNIDIPEPVSPYNDTDVQNYLTENNYVDEDYLSANFGTFTAEQQTKAFSNRFAAKTTTDLVEGDNLYYTDTRVEEYLTANNYTQEDWVNQQITTLTGTVTELTTTDGIDEGIYNLYYTDERSRSSISVDGDLSYDSTTGVIFYTGPTDFYTRSETDARISERITEVAAGDITLTGYATEAYADATIDSKTTDDLTEGTTNLYYTETRVADFLSDNNYATKLFVTTTVNNTIFQSNFSNVATSGSYNDLSDTPTIPTNISAFTNDSNYLVDSDIRQEFIDITSRLDVLEEYTILDVYKNMYKNTSVNVQTLEFSIRIVDAFRLNWLASGQSDPAWDSLVEHIYNNDAVAIEQAFTSLPVLEQTVFLMPLLYTINSGVTLVNQALGTTYDTMTFDELNNSPTQWYQRNSGYETSKNTLNSQLVQADRTFIKNILKNNSYADFTRDTVVSGWNPS